MWQWRLGSQKVGSQWLTPWQRTRQVSRALVLLGFLGALTSVESGWSLWSSLGRGWKELVPVFLDLELVLGFPDLELVLVFQALGQVQVRGLLG